MDYQAKEDLVARFQALDRRRRDAMIERTAKVLLGPSVVRVFKKQTSRDLFEVLTTLDLGVLQSCKTQVEFDNFFFAALDKLDLAILQKNRDNPRLGNGHKWGHAAKVLCLFLRDLVLYTRYFDDAEAHAVQGLLYVPIDNVVMNNMRKCGVQIAPQRIKEIDTPEEFRAIQAVLTEAANQARVPRILFDDVWSETR